MKTSASLFIFPLVFSFFLSSAQTAPDIEWQNTIGGENYEFLNSVQQTSDGGYILGGYTTSLLSWEDYLVVKLESDGEIEWQQRIGGSYQDFLESIDQTSDGGYILGGTSSSEASGDKTEDVIGSTDFWIVKLNENGEVEWDNTIGGDYTDFLSSINQTSDGGYIIMGLSYSGISGDKTEDVIGEGDFWVVKLDVAGNLEWQNTIGGNKLENFSCLALTKDGGYILGGSSNSDISGDKTEASLGIDDYWVIKLDSFGEIEWQNTIGGTEYDGLLSLYQSSDGGYILGGYSESGVSGDKTQPEIGDGDYWVIKLDDSGQIEWQNTIGGTGHESWPLTIRQAADGGYFMGGTSSSDSSGNKTEDSEGSRDYWFVKLSDDGSIKWQSTIGGDTIEYLRSTEQCADGGYILGGASHSGISGDKTEANYGEYDYWVVKLSPEPCPAPSNLSLKNLSASSVTLTWDEIGEALGYKVRYKVTGATDWINVQSADNDKTLGGLDASTEYAWQVKSICGVDPIISSEWSEKQFFTTLPARLGEEELVPIAIWISPNPFSSSTTISFRACRQAGSLEQNSHNTVGLYDLAGRKIKSLLDENFAEGDHQINFNRESLAAGIYFVQLKTDEGVVTKKIVIE